MQGFVSINCKSINVNCSWRSGVVTLLSDDEISDDVDLPDDDQVDDDVDGFTNEVVVLSGDVLCFSDTRLVVSLYVDDIIGGVPGETFDFSFCFVSKWSGSNIESVGLNGESSDSLLYGSPVIA